jgi:hypothetical protein
LTIFDPLKAGPKPTTMQYLPGSILLMSTLQSDDPSVGIKETASQSRPALRELRGTTLTIIWAAAVLIATAGWLYFIVQMAWVGVSWFFGG